MEKYLKQLYFKNKKFKIIKNFKKFILHQLKIISKNFIFIFNRIKQKTNFILKLTKKFKRSPTNTLKQKPLTI